MKNTLKGLAVGALMIGAVYFPIRAVKRKNDIKECRRIVLHGVNFSDLVDEVQITAEAGFGTVTGANVSPNFPEILLETLWRLAPQCRGIEPKYVELEDEKHTLLTLRDKVRGYWA